MTQNEMIMEHFKNNTYLTRRQAMVTYGIGNLPARIKELREDGIVIVTDSMKSRTGSRYGMYRLETEEERCERINGSVSEHSNHILDRRKSDG